MSEEITAKNVALVKELLLPDVELCVHKAVKAEIAPLVARVEKLEGKRWRLTALWTGLGIAAGWFTNRQ